MQAPLREDRHLDTPTKGLDNDPALRWHENEAGSGTSLAMGGPFELHEYAVLHSRECAYTCPSELHGSPDTTSLA